MKNILRDWWWIAEGTSLVALVVGIVVTCINKDVSELLPIGFVALFLSVLIRVEYLDK